MAQGADVAFWSLFGHNMPGYNVGRRETRSSFPRYPLSWRLNNGKHTHKEIIHIQNCVSHSDGSTIHHPNPSHATQIKLLRPHSLSPALRSLPDPRIARGVRRLHMTPPGENSASYSTFILACHGVDVPARCDRFVFLQRGGRQMLSFASKGHNSVFGK